MNKIQLDLFSVLVTMLGVFGLVTFLVAGAVIVSHVLQQPLVSG